ncbi:MAG: carbon-nitrogen hydrolase family protein [Saprospiraceae bacterium]|nr:carbon-nitrogen hydrolase family protein [Saprospiraceae bacterium]
MPSGQELRVALVQPVPELDVDKSLALGEAYCRTAKSEGADVAVFPEMYSLGYYTKVDFDVEAEVKAWKQLAIKTDGAYVTHFRSLAKELDMAIVITYLEDLGSELRNAASLIDRHGELLYTYHKVHTCVFFKMEGSLVRGDDFFVANLDTRLGPVPVGIMTCYDREFPESARILMLKGAEVILTPNACGLDEKRINQFQSRAWENSVAVAMANYAEEQGDGHSCAFTADGSQLLMAPEHEEGVFTADINLEELRNYRKTKFWGNAWRQVDRYELLISPEVKEPFIRRDVYGRKNTR